LGEIDPAGFRILEIENGAKVFELDIRPDVRQGLLLLGFQVGKFLINVVAQEQRLASVADEDQGVIRNCELIHVSLLKRRRCPLCRLPACPINT
jgi:hypothetical protein